jgi:zinc carboxypeptidase
MSIVTLAAAIACAAGGTVAQDASRAPLLDFHDVQFAMTRLASEHKDLVTVIPVGALPSRSGRKLEALRIAAGALEPGRPAILLVADVDGPRVWTTGLALDHARRLVEGYAADPRTRKLLDTTTIYVIPRANPDAAEARFGKPLQQVEASGTGVDDDRDGRQGEDPPCDVDGDGIVTWMRIPDPDGEWMADPTDPRANVRADPKKGQRGQWKLVPEGRDTDKDKKASEDAEHDAIVNRNFPQGWKEHAAESGVFATDEPEARDLCDFVLEHKDVSLVLTYGALDDFADKPKTVKDDASFVKRVPQEGMPESDATLMEEVGRRYKKVAKSHARSEGDDHGTFQAWCRYERGLWCLNLELWSIPLDTPPEAKPDDPKPPEAKPPEAKPDEKKPDEKKPDDKKKEDDKPSPSDDAKRLRWIDAKSESARFVPWKKKMHPDLGIEVEIGGFAPFATIEPPAAERDEIAAGELEFLLGLGDFLPRVRITDCTAKDIGGGVWEIQAALTNDALLPFESVAGRHSEVVRPARVSIALPKDAQLLAGNREQLVGDLAGSGARKKLRWLVHGAAPSALAVDVDTDHAGTAHVVPEVK